MTTTQNNLPQEEKEKEEKIQELREIIANAQETISSATQLLSAIQGISPEEMPINRSSETEEDDGQSIYGYFDGQIMIGDDGKQYPVPANYASKSKLVEGDKLKLNITPDNKFVYKQIGPVQRNYLIGVVKKDNKGNFTIQTPEKEYQVLLAATTYFKIEEGDEVTLIVPQGKDTIWGAIENVLQKNASPTTKTNPTISNQSTTQSDVFENPTDNTDDEVLEIDLSEDLSSIDKSELTTNKKSELSAIEKLEKELEEEKIKDENHNKLTGNDKDAPSSIKESNDWESDIEKLKQEAGIAATQ